MSAALFLSHEWFRGRTRREIRQYLREVGLPGQRRSSIFRHAGSIVVKFDNWDEVDAWVTYLQGIEGMEAHRCRPRGNSEAVAQSDGLKPAAADATSPASSTPRFQPLDVAVDWKRVLQTYKENGKTGDRQTSETQTSTS
jgi:hypothetical protein